MHTEQGLEAVLAIKYGKFRPEGENVTQKMNYTTLISVDHLTQLQASGQPLMVFDCSFDLMNRKPVKRCTGRPTSTARCTPIWTRR